MKWVKYLIAISGVLLVTQFAGASHAYATSDYDNLIQNTSDLKVTYSGHSDLDVSNNYMGYFKNAITDDVAQYQCNSPSSSGADPTWCNQVIDDSLDHGDWLISVIDEAYHKAVVGQFCDQKITSITGRTDSYPSFIAKYLMGNTSTPANCVAVNLVYQNYTNGIHLAVSAQGWAGLTTNAIELNGVITSMPNQGYQYLFTSTAPYPDGYEGSYIPSEYTPPTPAYVGKVDCGTGTPLSMIIYQAGNNGSATLTPGSSAYEATWSYDLTNDPYSFSVTCSDWITGPVTTVDPTTSSNDWMCAPNEYCVLD